LSNVKLTELGLALTLSVPEVTGCGFGRGAPLDPALHVELSTTSVRLDIVKLSIHLMYQALRNV